MVVSRKIRDIVLCLALLGLPLLFLQANVKSPDQINPLDRLLLRISAPIQAAITAAASGVHQGWRRYVYLVGVERNNERLRKDVNKLRHQLREAKRRVARIDRYERLLAFRAARGFETIGARVISRQSSPFVRVLRLKIDRGEESVRAGLPVVAAKGVVGRITRAVGSYSEVMLAVDPKSAIDVVIQRTGARGVLRGIDGSNRYRCRIEYLLRKEQVKVGDQVVTSASAGVFPRALPVGRISRVTRKTYGLYQEVEVTPVVDFASLEDTLVILAPPPPAATVDRAKGPARGLVP